MESDLKHTKYRPILMILLLQYTVLCMGGGERLNTVEFHAAYNAIRLSNTLTPGDLEKEYSALYTRIKGSDNSEQIILVSIQLHLQTIRLRQPEAAAKWLLIATKAIKSLNSSNSTKAAQLLLKKNQLYPLLMKNQYVTLIGTIDALEKELSAVNIEINTHLHNEQIVVDQRDVAKFYLLFGGALYYTSDFDAAQTFIHKSLVINKKINNLKGIADGYNNLSLIAMEENKHEDAIAFLNDSLAIVKQIGDTEQYITFLTNQGIQYKNMALNDQAMNSFKQVLSHPEIEQYSGYKLQSMLKMAEIMMDSDVVEAESLIQQTADLAEKVGVSEFGTSRINMALAKLNQHKGLHEKTIELVEKNLIYYESNNNRSQIFESHLILGESYRQLGAWEDAYKHLQLYADIRHEVEQNASKNSVNKLHSQYKENVASERIAHLQTESQLKSLEIKAGNKQKLIIIISSLFTLLTVLLLVSRHYIKKEARRLTSHNLQIAVREKQLNLLSHAFRSTSDAVWITNSEFEIEEVNESYVRHTLRKKNQVVGKPLVLAPVKDQGKYLTEHIMKQVKLHGTWRGELYDQRADGQVYPLELEVEAIKNNANQVIHYLGVFRDITEQKMAEQELQTLATHDRLTNLPNRTLLIQLIHQACANARNSESTLAVLLIEVSGYKKINDTVGHAVGDELIMAIAERLKAVLPEDDALGRITETTFCVLVEHIESKIEAVRVALEINTGFEPAFVIKNQPYIMSANVGIALCPDDGIDAEDLLRKASIAVLDGKNNQNQPYNFFKHNMNEVIMAQLSHEQRIIKAINNDSFEFHYQPILDMATGQVVGAEALIRWVQVDGSLILPDQFIHIAERAGLIEQVDRIVLDSVFDQVAKWQREPHLFTGMVAINLSASIFSHPEDLLSLLNSKTTQYGVQPKHIKIELTEGMLLDNIDQAIETINQVKSMGFQISLDDFGTGYSSLNYLKKFAIDYLKIDRSFITSIHSSKVDQSIVKTIIDLANTLNLKVIAEGVECEQHVDILKAMNCDFCQGYYYSKPLPKVHFEALVAA